MVMIVLFVSSKLKRDSTPNMEAVLETDLLLQQKEAEVKYEGYSESFTNGLIILFAACWRYMLCMYRIYPAIRQDFCPS